MVTGQGRLMALTVTALTIRNIASGQPEEGFVVGRRTGTDSGGGNAQLIISTMSSSSSIHRMGL